MATVTKEQANQIGGAVRVAALVFNGDMTPNDFYAMVANADDVTIKVLCELIGTGWGLTNLKVEG